MDRYELQNQAEYYRGLYRLGKCSRELAQEKIMPYLDFVNSKSKELCKKYNQRHKDVNFSNYIR